MPLDRIKYEIFAHRLWAIGEEGRLALQRVTASPIVAQGGECMSSFYAPDGTMILACSGHLRFAAATSDAIKALIAWYGERPGFFAGDQIFFNDPYVAGSHTYDQMVAKPIFHEGALIAWTASSSHTADVGGLLRGGATEIFHEGIRILGLKVVERGQFRQDVFRTIVEQCRDPEYVGLDLKSRIAANNVCAQRFLELVHKLGADFVSAAGQRLIRDSEELARAKLRALPDGTWRSRLYASAPEPGAPGAQLITIACAMTKRGDELFIDLGGTDPQMRNDFNSTLPSTMAHVAIALTNQLFWDVPWNDGKMAPVHVSVPPGSILNCLPPAACGGAPMIGGFLVGALSECLAKMLYAGGLQEDVNAGWSGYWYWGGPGYLYGGHNREGLLTAMGLYDIHGGGLGATPSRDGVDTGGHMNIPSGGISDVERIEMQYPFVYFTRRHVRDGCGFGWHRGGSGSERLLMIYGSQDASVDFRPYGAVPHGSFGLFGGHPAGFGGTRASFAPGQILERLAHGEYPAGPEEVEPGGWGRVTCPEGSPARFPLPEGTLIADFTQSGGGYGDPIERDPEAVARDVRADVARRDAAERVCGVVLDAAGRVDDEATRRQREAIRQERRRRGRSPSGRISSTSVTGAGGPVVLHFHESLDVILPLLAKAGPEPGRRKGPAEVVPLLAKEGLGEVVPERQLVICCSRCGHSFCSAGENYKLYALEIHQDLEELAGHRVPSGEPYAGEYLEYVCPVCATLLQVDTFCPSKGGETPLWDIQLDVRWLSTLASTQKA